MTHNLEAPDDDPELKGLADQILKQLKIVFDGESLKAAVDMLIRKNYHKAIDEFEQKYELRVNIVPHQEAINFLSDYTFSNMKDMNEAMVSSLRKELVQGLLNNEGQEQLQKRVQKVMSVSADRARTIARTESHRAYNMGGHHAAKQSGLRLEKVWYNPNPESEVCKHLAGTRKPIDQPFVFKGEEFMLPPAHPNCRSRVLYEQVDER